jgi:hypothetical protein
VEFICLRAEKEEKKKQKKKKQKTKTTRTAKFLVLVDVCQRARPLLHEIGNNGKIWGKIRGLWRAQCKMRAKMGE